MSAELRRNVRLELRPGPCATALAILAVLAYLATAATGPLSPVGLERLQLLGLAAFCFFGVWGLRKASGAVSDEVLGGTWDQQRISGQDATGLIAGKLLGATAFSWFGALMGLLLYVPALLARGGPALTALHTATLVLGALLAHTLALGGSLLTAEKLRKTRRGSRGLMTTLGWLLGVWLGLWVLGAGLQVLGLGEAQWQGWEVRWWLTLPGEAFVPLSLALGWAWALTGAHRLMRLELQESVTPLPWLGFLAFVPLYLLPFWQPLGATVPGALTLTALTGLSATWGLMLGERLDGVRLRLLAGLWQRDERLAWWGALPLWPFALAVSLASTACLVATALLGTLGGGAAPGPGGALLVPLALFVVRDAALVLAAQLATPRHREPVGPIAVGLVVLYVLLPAIAVVSGAGSGALAFLLPLCWDQSALSAFGPGTLSAGSGTMLSHQGLMRTLAALPGVALALVLAGSVARGVLAERVRPAAPTT
ncbi:MAG: hypothetical protein VKS61_06745 [Candidatus Sericytochromatia bacterium]|nr:hypothetical protein [Candidatus Sericytochromatia bacterium]